MNGGAKLAIGITVLVVLYIVWDWYSKKKEDEKKKEAEPTCEKLEKFEYYEKKKEKAFRIGAEYGQKSIDYQNTYGITPGPNNQNPIAILIRLYEADAIKAGVTPGQNSTPYNILSYVYQRLAGEEMDAEGYCSQLTGKIDMTPGDNLYD